MKMTNYPVAMGFFLLMAMAFSGAPTAASQTSPQEPLSSVSASVDQQEPEGPGWRSLDDLAEARIAVFNGTAQDLYASQAFPKAQISRFNSPADFVLALKTGKVDVAISDLLSIQEIARENPELAILADNFHNTAIGAAFRKGDQALRERFDHFLETARADGTLEAMRRRWVVENPETVVMPAISIPESGETLRVGTSLLIGLPFVSQANGQFIGHDIELVQTFASREGFRLELAPLEFDALIASLATGKIDMIVSQLSITPERQAKVAFSAPYSYENSAALVQKKNLATPLTSDRENHQHRGAGAKPAASPPPGGWRSLDDLSRGRIAVFAGTIQEQYLAQAYPEAQVTHLTGYADLIATLQRGEVDAGLIIATNAPELLAAHTDMGLLGKPVLPVSTAVAFRPDDQELRERFNGFLALILADGTYQAMYRRWFEGDPTQVVMPEIAMPKTGPILRLGISLSAGLPYLGLVNNDYVGFDLELVRRFAAHEGLRLDLTPLEFSALIPALLSGKLDLIASALAVTEERQKQVAFSTPYAEVSSVTLALKKHMDPGRPGMPAASRPGEAEAAPSFLAELQASFYANFVLEQRWRLVLNGLWATLLISVAATLFGTLLGGLICWLRMSPRTLPRLLGSGYIFLIRGLPVLLLLMLIFYVAFAAVNIDPLIVAIIAFGMNFAAYVSEMFRTGIEGVERGQSEAGIAMGFTRLQTFLYIVLPQATRRILPVYRGEFISLVKMTSIVGYIGVQDLTKAGDIIRSRTFEAFFPLLMVAAIYFLIIAVLGLALDYVDRRTDPKKRIDQGMKTQAASQGG